MRVAPHHHKCADCGAKTDCTGEVVDNYDGWPSWSCAFYHLITGDTNRDFICEICGDKRDAKVKA